jgi:hypothetical protein
MTKPLIELVYFRGCPHVEGARAALRTALQELGLPVQWREWDQARPGVPSYVLGHGSPTVLVSGRDVTGAKPRPAARACRADGIPSPQVIAAALQHWLCR